MSTTHSLESYQTNLIFLATIFDATVEGGSFKTTKDNGFVRAMEIMNSKSSNEFRWSVKITDDAWIAIGIASKLNQKNEVYVSDENSIMIHPYAGSIWAGNRISHGGLTVTRSGAECHFKFQPKMKKLVITFVSSISSTFYLDINKEFQKDKEYALDIKEDVDYFPVIQGTVGGSATLFKPQD